MAVLVALATQGERDVLQAHLAQCKVVSTCVATIPEAKELLLMYPNEYGAVVVSESDVEGQRMVADLAHRPELNGVTKILYSEQDLKHEDDYVLMYGDEANSKTAISLIHRGKQDLLVAQLIRSN